MTRSQPIWSIVAMFVGACAHLPERSPPGAGTLAIPQPAGPTPAAPPVLSAPPPAVAMPQPAPEPPREPYPFEASLPAAALPASAPALHFANLSPAGCRAEMRARGLPVERVGGATPGVATPVRLTGPLGGVEFRAPGRKSIYGVLDCRLVLALSELARVLERHAVAAVQIDNTYRPHARLPGSRKRSQHSYGLAADIPAIELADGRRLSVEENWDGALGRPACGPHSAPSVLAEETIELRNIVCDVAAAGIFHHLLTPNFNAAHHNHLHFDIKRDEKRWIIE